MDIQFLIAINLIALSAIAVTQVVMARPDGYVAWSAVNSAIVVIGILAVFLIPDWSGYLVAALFGLFVAGPLILGRLAMKASMAGQVAKAAKLARFAVLLHPSASVKRNADVLAAIAQRDSGGGDGALDDLAMRQSPEHRGFIEMHAATGRGEWDKVLRLVRESKDRSASNAGHEIRALGETGRLDDMVEAFTRTTGGRISLQTHLLLGMMCLAFAGRAEAVRNIYEGRLPESDPEFAAYWVAVAEAASGDAAGVGQATLMHLAKSARLDRVRAAAQRQLNRPLAELARHMSSASRATIAALEQRIAARAPQRAPTAPEYSSVPSVPLARGNRFGRMFTAYPVTIALIALNVIGYGIQIYSGDAESSRTLMRLGALWPDSVILKGEWWRLVTSTLLHGFPLHLAVNMLALWSLGSDYEDMVGSLRMFVVYAVGGVGASAAVLWLMWTGWTETSLLVGASGAIFALFGALAAHVLVNYLRTRDRAEMARLVNILVILAINVVVTFAVPMISISAHVAGLLIGFALGLLFALTYRRAHAPR